MCAASEGICCNGPHKSRRHPTHHRGDEMKHEALLKGGPRVHYGTPVSQKRHITKHKHRHEAKLFRMLIELDVLHEKALLYRARLALLFIWSLFLVREVFKW